VRDHTHCNDQPEDSPEKKEETGKGRIVGPRRKSGEALFKDHVFFLRGGGTRESGKDYQRGYGQGEKKKTVKER